MYGYICYEIKPRYCFFGKSGSNYKMFTFAENLNTQEWETLGIYNH